MAGKNTAACGIFVSRIAAEKRIDILLCSGFRNDDGTALGLIFVPLSGTALGMLPPEKLGNGSAVFNLIRNVGGSIGISAVNTITQRRLQSHRGEMVRSLGGTSLAAQRYIASLTAAMQRHAGPHVAMQRASADLRRISDDTFAFIKSREGQP